MWKIVKLNLTEFFGEILDALIGFAIILAVALAIAALASGWHL